MAASLKFGNGNWATKEGSALAYSDKNGNFKPLPFDFTRASNASVVNKQGLVETVGNGIPRIDFADSEDGALKLEPQSTNLIPYSEDFSQWNVVGNVTTTADYALSPSGENNATRLQWTNATNYIYQSLSHVGNDFTLSIYLKSNTDVSQNVNLFMDNNFQSKDVVVTTEWQRFEFTNTTTPTQSNRNLGLIKSGSQVGDLDISIWGAQFEQQSYATSYIPTEGSAVTRNKDVCDNTNIPTLLGQTEGSFLIELNKSVANAEIFSFNRSTSNSFHVFANAGSGYYQVIAYYEGGFYNKPTFLPSTDKVKIAVSYKNNEYKLYANGAEIFSSNVFTWTPNVPLEDLYFNKGGYIGGNKTSEIKALVVWKEALSDEELTELTQV